MSKCFFDVCVRCKRTFTNEAEFVAHMSAHTANVTGKRPIDEIADRVKMEAATVPGVEVNPDEDTRLAAARKVMGKRKKLIAAGIEAGTMSPSEVETRYAEEKKKGTVK